MVQILCALLLLFLNICNGAPAFDVYRLLQYDKGTAQFGSRRVLTDQLAATTNVKSDKLSKYIIVAKLEEFITTPDLLQRCLNRQISGLLVILPDASEATSDWASVEKQFMEVFLDVPVWFTYSSSQILDLYTELQNEELSGEQVSLLMGDSYKLSVPTPDASPIKNVESKNIQALLQGAKADNAATIAIVAYWDSFGIAPELANGSDSNGSGVSALLELARLFSKLNKKSAKTQGDYNIMFLLTGAGHLNFTGTSHWLENAESKLESVEFALCLDSIGAAPGLNLHVSRSPAKDLKAKRIYDTFSVVAKQMNIPFNVVQKKVNMTSQSLPWEHEHFSVKRILAATLSGHTSPVPPSERSSIFDVKVDEKILVRNVQFLAESLSRVIYDLPLDTSGQVFSGSLGVSSDYVTSWARTLGASPRMIPFLGKDDTVVSGLFKELNRHVKDTTLIPFPVSPAKSPVYYDKTVAQMSAYRSKHVTFDIMFSVCLIVFLASLHTALKGPKQTMAQVVALFSGKKRT